MPTQNYNFPTWGDTPPEGATGKTLRDTIIGVSESSFANLADAAIKAVSDKADNAITAPDSPQNGYILIYDSTLNTWTAQALPSSLPTVTSADDGKFLRVVNGVWATDSVQNAEEVQY